MSRDGLITIRGVTATIEQLPETKDARGDATPGAPTTFATGKALIQPLGGSELLTAQQIFADVTHRILWTPFVAGVRAKMRVTANGVSYDIGTVLPVRDGRDLDLLVVQRGA